MVILTEVLINVNFQNKMYLCLNKCPRALIRAGANMVIYGRFKGICGEF